jgi:hypothetical protein
VDAISVLKDDYKLTMTRAVTRDHRLLDAPMGGS